MDLYYFDGNARDNRDQEGRSTKFPSATLLKKRKQLNELTPFELVVEQAKTHCSKTDGCKDCPLNCDSE